MTPPPLRLQRCWNHEAREAVSRCPGCRRAFCRECVTEFQGQMLCATCLKQASAAPARKAFPLGGLLRVGGLAAGFLLAWWTLYSFGDLLLKIPPSFHDGSGWASQ